MRTRHALILAASLICALAAPALAVEPDAPDRLLSPDMMIGIKLRQTLGSAAEASDLPKEAVAAIDAFYASRYDLPLWIDRGALGERAKAVMAEIRRADDWGLEPKDYKLPPEPAPGGNAALNAEELARTELMLTKAALLYAHHAHVGRVNPQTVSTLIDLNSTPPDPGKVLKGLAEAPDAAAFLLSFHPKHKQFELLRQKYLALRGKKEEKEEPQVQIPDGPKLKPGVRDPQIALLRARLKVPAPENADQAALETYDPALVEAVKTYQDSEGLKADGIIGRSLRAALNASGSGTSKTPKLDRILVNLERWRWMPEELGSYYVWDSIPEFLTRVFKDGREIFQEKIVVGKPDTPTPVFSDEMEFIEFNPFWNVPDSIKQLEILPSIRGNYYASSALDRHNLKIEYNGRAVDPDQVDWSAVDIKRFHFYQPPGGPNVLGVVKFMFPNHNDVYMHDTPSKSLFDEKVRTFSHGCMRVHNPLKLAEVLLGHDKGWTAADVSRAVAGGNQQVTLTHKIPVHITYFTTWVEDDGTVSLRGDYYGMDQRIALALKGQAQDLGSDLAVATNAASRITVADNADPGGFTSSSSKKGHPGFEEGGKKR